jgi:hypothetical protein
MLIMAMASCIYIITTVIMVLLEGKYVDSSTANGTSYFFCWVFLAFTNVRQSKSRAPTLDLEKIGGITFLHELIKLEGQSSHSTLSSISSMYCAS